MFDRARLLTHGAALLFMFSLGGYAQAADSSRNQTEASTTHRASHQRAKQSDIIDEIVVVARKKVDLPDLGGNRVAKPLPEKTSAYEFRLLPAYDPQEMQDLFLINNEFGRTNVVELFRFDF